MGIRAPRVLAAVLAACTVAACTGSPAPQGAARTSTGSTASDTARPSATVTGPRGEAGPDPTAAPDQPLVIAVHHTSPLRSISASRARQIVDRGRLRDVASGPSREAVRDVVHGRSMFAVLPAEALGPEVRPLAVHGIDPVRRPSRYPLRTRADHQQAPVVRVTVVGDVMLGRGVARAAAGTGDPVHALRPLQTRLSAADITVGNLENTLSRAGAPTQGGDSFAAAPVVAAGLRDAGFDVLGLANNHLGDFGDRALVQTVRRLRAAGLDTFGAGATVRQAWAPSVLARHGVRFGFLGFNAIGETPAVAPGQPGAVSVGMPPRTGPLDHEELRRFTAAVRRLDRRVDVVVVMPHWGTQYTNRPEPIQRRVARRLVAAGADVVAGGHPHWLQGVELVRGRLVAHSLGNFVFDMDFMRETQEGAMLELTFWGGELKAAELVPYVMDDSFAPRVVTGVSGERVLALMRATSGPSHRPVD